MQVEDEKHVSTSMNTKISGPVPYSQAAPSRRGVVIVLCAVAIWSTTPVFIDQLQTAGPHFLESNYDCAPMDWSGSDCGERGFDANGITCAELKKMKSILF